MRLHRCSGERCGRANARTSTEENFFHADADPAPEKENDNLNCGEKEIADTDAHTNSVTQEEIFDNSQGRGIARPIADCFPEKETHSGGGRRDAYADSEEEKDFADAVTDCVAASKEENVAVTTTI